METHVLRRPLFVWFPVAAAVAVWGLALWLAAALSLGRDGGRSGIAAAELALAGTAVVLWAIGWESAIRFTDTQLSVTNVVLTATVRWTDVAGVLLEDGLRIHLRDGRRLGSIQFGGSLIGGRTGYPTYSSGREALRTAHRRALASLDAPEGPVRLRRSLRWRPALCALALVYGSVLLVLALR